MATFCGTYYREKRRSCQLLLFFNSLWGLFWASIHPVSVIFFAERWFAEKGTMEKALTKVGSSWMSQKVRKDVSDIADDLSSLSSTVEEKAKWFINKLKGKPSRSLPDLLRDYNLPTGLFPRNVTCYEFDEPKGKLVVHLPSPCEVSCKDSSVVRYANRVKATLSRGKLTGIEGMKTKVLVWVKVTGVNVETYKSDKVWFTAGVKKSRPRDAYESAREAVKVEEF